IEAYAGEPQRLASALLAMQRFFAQQQHDELELWKERTHAAFDDHPLAMWIYDLETRYILEANATACAQYGYSLEELRHLPAPDLRPEEDRRRAVRSTTTPPRRSNVFGRQRRKDGSVFFIESFGSDYPMPDRKARLAVVKDITEQRMAELRFERLSESGVIGIT